MRRLAVVELRRLWARQIFRMLTIAAVVLIAIIIGTTAKDSHPPTADELAMAQEQIEIFERDLPRMIADCEAEEERAGADFDCDQMVPPTVDDFTSSSIYSFADEAPNDLVGAAGIFIFLAFIVGASAIGAEWQAGTMAGLLTWEARRGRVLAAKTAAVAAALATVTAVLLAVTVGAYYVVGVSRGTTDGTTTGLITSLGLTELRAVGLAMLAASVGAALAGTLRSTVGALIIAFAYLLGVEGLIRSWWDGSDRWLLTHNATAWLDDGYRASRWNCPEFGGECTETITYVGLGGGALVLGAVAAALIAVHAITFVRRDVM